MTKMTLIVVTGCRYTEFVSPIIKAIQELSDRVEKADVELKKVKEQLAKLA